MLDGVILLWFILTALSVAFVAIDIRTTPEATVMKWGFVLVTLFTGPFGAFLICARMPRTVAGDARGLCRRAVAPGARLRHALRGW